MLKEIEVDTERKERKGKWKRDREGKWKREREKRKKGDRYNKKNVSERKEGGIEGGREKERVREGKVIEILNW